MPLPSLPSPFPPLCYVLLSARLTIDRSSEFLKNITLTLSPPSPVFFVITSGMLVRKFLLEECSCLHIGHL